MIAKEAQFLTLLEGGKQFEVPIYQRTYAWTDEDRRQLWNDLLRAGRTPKQNAHFMGSVVYIQPSTGMANAVTRARLIDGQQRVTTVTLLLLALVERLRELGDLTLKIENEYGDEDIETVTADWVLNSYLLNPTVSGDTRYKLILTQSDRATLMHYLGNVPLPEKPSVNVQAGLKFFRGMLRAPGVEVQDVFLGLRKLQVVDVTLEQGKDNPQLIFESLNSTGLDLSQADLIRNNILMDLPGKEQKELYEHYWLPMEQLFTEARERTGDQGLFDRFMRDFLTLRTRSIPNQRDVYKEFKRYRVESKQTVQALMQDIAGRARHYADVISPARVQDPELQLALSDIAALDVRVSHPFLLELLEDHAAGLLSVTDLLGALRLVEAFVLRRAVCGLRTSPLNKFFAGLTTGLDKTHYLAGIERALLKMRDQGQDGFPSDQAFEEALLSQPLYQRNVCRQVLLRLARALNPKEQTVEDCLTIEHVLPQNENLSEPWRKMLGEHWAEVQARLVHTLGNLTLTGHNPELGDRPFDEKKVLVKPKGYKYSNVAMTRDIAEEERWDEATIKARAKLLSQKALGLWPFPHVSEEELQALRTAPKPDPSQEAWERLMNLAGDLPQAVSDLTQRIKALKNASQRNHQSRVSFYKGPRSFMELSSKDQEITCWALLGESPAELGEGWISSNWAPSKHGNWWKYTLRGPEDVTQLWPALQAAWERLPEGKAKAEEGGASVLTGRDGQPQVPSKPGTTTSAQYHDARAFYKALIESLPSLGGDLRDDLVIEATQKSAHLKVVVGDQRREFARLYTSFSNGGVAVRLNLPFDAVDNPAGLGRATASDNLTSGFVADHFEGGFNHPSQVDQALDLIRQAYEAHRAGL